MPLNSGLQAIVTAALTQGRLALAIRPCAVLAPVFEFLFCSDSRHFGEHRFGRLEIQGRFRHHLEE
jgi:hypothetical protein